MNKARLITLFMISLIITMPAYSSLAYATVRRVSASGGTDGIQGFIREEDWINFDVDVDLPDDDEITQDQLLLLPSAMAFDSCVGPNLDGSTTCSLRFPAMDTWYFVGSSTYLIRVFKDDGTKSQDVPGAVMVDNLAPAVKAFDIIPRQTGEGEVSFRYDVEDYASDKGDTSVCVGLDTIEFYTFDASFVEIVDADGTCEKTGTLMLSTALFEEGTNVIYAKAVDNFGQEAEPREASFSLDRTGPVIDIDSLEIVDEFGNSIDYIGTEEIQDEISVDIIGADLDVNSVFADFTSLNPDRYDYADAIPYCVKTSDDVTTCSWSVLINIDTSGTKYVHINASDLLGNSAGVSISKSFVFDDAAPVVNEIRTDIVEGGASYASGTDNTIIASISESGSGFSIENIILHIGTRGLKPNRCEAGVCYWEGVDFSQDGSVEVWIGEDSSDILGNEIAKFSSDIIVDRRAPKLLSLDIEGIGGALPAYEYFKTFDSLKITAELEEENIITEAYADFSSIIQGAEKVLADDCSKNNGTYTCVWNTQPIDVEGYINSNIEFTFVDVAGNTLVEEAPIEVYELLEGEGLDYWKHSVVCSPKLIDRQTMPFVNHRIFCHVKLSSAAAETVEINLEECEGPTDYLETAPEFFNNYPGSTDPYIKFTLAVQESGGIDELDFNCKVKIVSKISEAITRFPETEEVVIPIRFYSMPLGSYGPEVERKIADAKNFAWYIDDWVADVNKYMNYGQMICNTLGALSKMFNALGAIGTLLSGGEHAPEPAGSAIGEARKSVQRAQAGVSGITQEEWGERLNRFCKFFSCRLYFDEVWTDKKSAGYQIGQMQKKALEGFNYVSGGTVIPGMEAWRNVNTGGELHFKTGKLNPKDSLIISTATLCLPGIVYNLNKLRQIQCMYVGCLENYASQGLPLTACEEQKEYATCKYVWGELFQILPFTGLINAISGMVRQALSSPFAVIDIPLAGLCYKEIEKPKGGAVSSLCLINEIAGLIADAYEDLEGLGERWEVQDYCDNIGE